MRTGVHSAKVVGVVLVGLGVLSGCPANTGTTPPPKVVDIATQIDSDAIALLPASPALVATVDTRAFFASGSGATAGPLVDMLLPLGNDAGFVATRDVDRITAGVYLAQGADVAAVVVGRFDPAHIDQAAQAHAATRSGGFIAQSQYAGHALYTTSDLGFTILTPHTALAGTQTGIKRTLDRIQDRHLTRDVPKWMSDALETQGASLAVAGDLANQQVSQLTAMAPWLNGPWINGLHQVRILGDFRDPGLNVAGTLTYATPQLAQASAASLRGIGTAASLAGAFSSMIPQLRGLDIGVADTNVQAKFAVDDQSMRRMIQTLSAPRPSIPGR
jgi:hypothetical protein